MPVLIGGRFVPGMADPATIRRVEASASRPSEAMRTWTVTSQLRGLVRACARGRYALSPLGHVLLDHVTLEPRSCHSIPLGHVSALSLVRHARVDGTL
eukprot:946701-Rhodomonas_salina.1